MSMEIRKHLEAELLAALKQTTSPQRTAYAFRLRVKKKSAKLAQMKIFLAH